MAGSLRVTGGRLVRRHFAVPDDADRGQVRPTSDRVREALFSSLQTLLEDGLDGVHALDAWAGSGALGIEALSRGASRATFLEKNKRVAATLKQNLTDLGLAPDADVIVDDAVRALERLPQDSFDLILMDPPYKEPLERALPAVVRVLREGGVLVLERDKKAVDPEPPGLSLVRDKVYGLTRVTMWRR